MVRIVVGLFIFAVALCAYIINAQHGGVLPEPTTADVAPTEVTSPAAPAPVVTDTATQIVESIVSRDLGFPTAPVPVDVAVKDTLKILGLDLPTDAASPPDQRFATLIGDALKAGTPDADIIATINTTARANGVTVPAGLVTADQMIDTASFLKAVLNTAVLVTKNADPVVPDLSNDPSAIITATGYDYTIAASDSIARIALKFYGDVGQTSRIIQANPIALARLDQITAGTTIKIPAF